MTWALTNALGGGATLVSGGRSLVFTPTNALLFGMQYQLDLTTGITDRQGVHLADVHHALHYRGRSAGGHHRRPPARGVPRLLHHDPGHGFRSHAAGQRAVPRRLRPGYVRVPAASVTPTSVLVRVPGTAMTGELCVVILGQLSNPFTLTVLPALAQTAPSRVTDVDLGFAPTDVALGPAGRHGLRRGHRAGSR